MNIYDLFIRPGEETYKVIILSAIVCWFLADYVFSYSYLLIPEYAKLTARQKVEWNGRLVAMVHACFAITLCPGYYSPEKHFYQFNNVTNSYSIDNFAYDPFVQFIYSISVGYFLWDSIVCIQHLWGFEYIMHGVLCFIAYYCNLYPFLHHWGRFYLGFFELSTIPLHFRGCMIMLGYHKDKKEKEVFFNLTVCLGCNLHHRKNIYWNLRKLQLSCRSCQSVVFWKVPL